MRIITHSMRTPILTMVGIGSSAVAKRCQVLRAVRKTALCLAFVMLAAVSARAQEALLPVRHQSIPTV